MATQVQFRRGSTAQNNTFTGAEGELSVDTTIKTLRVHDGATQGGFEMAKKDLSNHAGVGILTASSFSGPLNGNVTGEVNAAAFDTNASGVVVTGIATATEFRTGAAGSAIGINTNTISGPATITLDPAGVGDNTGLVVIKGDLQVDGTTTTVNSTTLTIDDKNIVLASGAANDIAADGGGITLESGQGNKTFNWVDSTDSWTSSEHMNLLTGKSYKINETNVLTSTTLGSGVVNSSLTSVGTLNGLTVSGFCTATDFNTTSDRNLKDNIRLVENAAELVTKLEGVHFTWKENGKETIGVIAQQIEEHLPQLVQENETHKTVNYNGLIGVLIEAVKEQGSRILLLEEEIERLKNKK